MATRTIKIKKLLVGFRLKSTEFRHRNSKRYYKVILQPAAMEKFSGITYQLDIDSQDNMEDFLYAYGIHNLEVIRNAVTMDSTFSLKVEGDRFTQTSETGTWKESFTYKLGEPFDQVSYDGRKIRSVITALGPTTHYHVQNHDGAFEMKIEKRFSAEKLVLILTLKDIVAKREYLAVNK